MKVVIMVLIVLLISGCAGTVSNVKDGEQLDAEHGYVVTRFHTQWKKTFEAGAPQVQYLVYRLDGEQKELKFVTSQALELNVMSLPAGEYRWRHIYCNDYMIELDNDYGFTVKPGQITYIGDVYAGLELRRSLFLGDFSISNNADTVLAALQKDYPNMISNHQFKTNLTRVYQAE